MPTSRWREHRRFADWRLGLKTDDADEDFDEGGFVG